MIRRNDFESNEIEIYRELSKYRNLPQISSRSLFGIVGTATGGESVLFPDSLQRGFNYEVTPMNERPKTEFEITGVISSTSDGHLNYLPSFNRGREIGRELKFYILAELVRKTHLENQGLMEKINDLKAKFEDFVNRNKS